MRQSSWDGASGESNSHSRLSEGRAKASRDWKYCLTASAVCRNCSFESFSSRGYWLAPRITTSVGSGVGGGGAVTLSLATERRGDLRRRAGVPLEHGLAPPLGPLPPPAPQPPETPKTP